jgi:hypothetical protein
MRKVLRQVFGTKANVKSAQRRQLGNAAVAMIAKELYSFMRRQVKMVLLGPHCL